MNSFLFFGIIFLTLMFMFLAFNFSMTLLSLSTNIFFLPFPSSTSDLPTSAKVQLETFTNSWLVASVFSRGKFHFSEKHISIGDWTAYSSVFNYQYRFNSLDLCLYRKYTFSFKGVKNIAIKGADDKSQITTTFVVRCIQDFLPMQQIY